MIPEKNLEEIRNYLKKAENPLFFFDDDPDGSCSYILLKKFCEKGKGVILKSSPVLDLKLFYKVDHYSPDTIFVLDIPVLDQEFIDKCNVPIVWIDHHPVLERRGIHYYNPLIWNKKNNNPTTFWCYKITKQNLWIATLGAVADWTLPRYAKEFTKIYPELLPKKIKTAPKAIFETKLGLLIKILSFNLKGKTTDVMKGIDAFTKINDPYEILNKTTTEGKLVYKNAEKYMKEYNSILEKASAAASKDKFLVFIYPDKKISFTSELANELIYRFSNKLIIVGREKGDEIKLSFRSTKYPLPEVLQKSVKNLNGHFGGHEYACGGAIKSKDFETFLNNFKNQLK